MTVVFIYLQINKPASPKDVSTSPASPLDKRVLQPKQQPKAQGTFQQ